MFLSNAREQDDRSDSMDSMEDTKEVVSFHYTLRTYNCMHLQ